MSLHELLDERQRKECDFSVNYRDNFNHGTPSHNHLSLIAKLFQHVQVMEYRIKDSVFVAEVAKKAFEAYGERAAGSPLRVALSLIGTTQRQGCRKLEDRRAVETVATLFIL